MTTRLALAGLLAVLGCDSSSRPEPEKTKSEQERMAPLSERVEKDRAILEQRWAVEARQLALRDWSEAPGSDRDDPTAASTSHWGSETESRLGALLLTRGDARRWATFGLGLRCGRKPERILAALLTAASGWVSKQEAPSSSLLETAGWAIGACASPEAEHALSAWLDPDTSAAQVGLGRAAVIGLGTLADRQGQLSEGTQAALLDAATSQKSALPLYPLSRLNRLTEAVGARLLDVAGELLGETKQRRNLILALGSVGPLASNPLGQILLSGDYAPAERSAAAQALSRLGADGQKVLDETLRDLLSRGLPTKPSSPLWGPLRATLLAVDLPTASASELRKLTSLPLPENPAPEAQAQRRRLLWLRCRAADLVARDRSLSPSLLSCDPDQGEVFKLAQINVLSRSRIEAQRVKVFEELATDENPRVAQAALRLIPGHPELSDVTGLLRPALASKNAGTQATAAKIIAAYPMRASAAGTKEQGPDETILSALKKILEQAENSPDEVVSSALGAAGALGALTLKPAVESICEGDRPALYAPAQQALALLGSPKRKCESQHKDPTPPEPSPPSPTVTITFESDFGPLELRLDDADSPRTRALVTKLAESGHYTAHGIHRASAGSALLFGDPDGDGYDDTRSPLTEVELSPTPFDALSVGVSTSSEKSTGSQLFVSLADAPQLRGRRIHLGRAEGPWHLLWPGDPLRNAQVKKKEVKKDSTP